MKILSTIRKILLHVCVVCSLVSITAKILDWYNPYMDFSGHVSGLQMVLYFVVILLAVTEGGKRISGKKSQSRMRERRLHNPFGKIYHRFHVRITPFWRMRMME